MCEELRLVDSYQWFTSVLDLSIDSAGKVFFSRLGYCDVHERCLIGACSAKRFVYSLPTDRLLNSADRQCMDYIVEASHLFTLYEADFPDESEDIPFFAVDIDVSCHERTQCSHDIHLLISKLIGGESVVLFRHEGSIMLSFLCRHSSGADRIVVYLSDWMDKNTSDVGQLEGMHIANMSLNSAGNCFDDLAFMSMREYYKDPMTKASSWYCVLDVPGARQDPFPLYYSREEILEAADRLLYRYLEQYGDDYLEATVGSVEVDEEFNLLDIEWELQNADEDRPIEQTPNYDSIDDDDQGDDDDLQDIPEDVLQDPVALLDWINGAQVRSWS